jgi:hypothetical protein
MTSSARQQAENDRALEARRRFPYRSRMRRAWAPFAVAAAGQLAFVGYVKDDAYIEFRYALNLARGHGLVFNVGDPPVEGFTSFLWTLGLALPARLGIDLVVAAKLAGGLAALGVIALVGRLVRARGGDATTVWRARMMAATSATLMVWAQSGMEPAAAALAVTASAAALAEGRLAAGLCAAAVGAGLRPEVHVVLAGACAVALARARRDRAARRPALVGVAAVLAATGAMHAARWRTFGGLLPNTALVKLAGVSLTAGLGSLGELAVTGLGGVVVALALVEAWRRRDDVALLGAASLLAFAAYLVRVGRDEMILVRLFLPVLPLGYALAAARLAAWRRGAGFLVAAVCASGLGFAAAHLPKTRYLALGETSYVRLAEAMRARARPGDRAIFQDLGRTPFEAMELRFTDPIGLVDRPIARALAADRCNPFLAPPSEAARARIRDRLLDLAPRFIAWVAYVERPLRAEVRARFDAGERERLLAPLVRTNGYYVQLADDPRFVSGYRFVDAWRRHDGYYLVLYERE